MPRKPSVIQPIDSSFDDVVSSLLHSNTTPQQPKSDDFSALIAELTTPKGWGVPVHEVSDQGQFRLDAEHYDPKVAENIEWLKSLGLPLVPLSDLAEVLLPSMFTRIWAKDAAHGLPYLNATDLMSYFALGVPSQERFLSKATDVKFENLIVKEGMILLTCSGTIGRTFDVPPELDGWAGTHDIVRILPKNAKLRGFLRACLSSKITQTQILGHTHGGQIDHVTDEQVGSCLIPLLPDSVMLTISEIADEADKLRNEGIKRMHSAQQDILKAISNG